VEVPIVELPALIGFDVKVRLIEGDVILTTWLSADEVEVAKLVSPPKTAVIECGLPAMVA
jgi:hypothetical protein